jgi:hypothetical protein
MIRAWAGGQSDVARTPAVVAENDAIGPSGECASTAFCAARNYGAGRSARIGAWLAACEQEERQFENGEHKTRPLETVGGMDVICRAEPPWRPFGKRQRQALPALVFHRRAQGRRAWCRPGLRPNINRFYIWPARSLAGTRPPCKRSASCFCLAHGAENLPDLERQAMDRVGKSAPMSNGPAATPF